MGEIYRKHLEATLLSRAADFMAYSKSSEYACDNGIVSVRVTMLGTGNVEKHTNNQGIECMSAKSHRWNSSGEKCQDCGDSDWMNDQICRPRFADPETAVTPDMSVSPSHAVTPMGVTTAEMIKVMQAAELGEAIQCRALSDSEWGDVNSPVWNWLANDYRIKPREPRVIWVNEYDCHEDMVHDTEEEARRKAGTRATRTAVKYVEEI